MRAKEEKRERGEECFYVLRGLRGRTAALRCQSNRPHADLSLTPPSHRATRDLRVTRPIPRVVLLLSVEK